MLLKRIGVMSSAKVLGTLYLIFGLIFGAIFSLISLIGIAMQQQPAGQGAPPQMFFGVAAIFALPLFYGLAGFIGGAIGAALYNFVAGFVGGIEMHFETDAQGA